jgi:hypothetical protein
VSDAGFRGTLAVSWNAHLPPELIDLLRSDQKDAFNAVMARIEQQAALTELVTELPGDRLDGLSLTWRRVLRIAVSLPPGTKAILEAIVAAGRAPSVSWLPAEAVAPTVRASEARGDYAATHGAPGRPSCRP